MSLAAWVSTQSGTCSGQRQILACGPEECRMAAKRLPIRILEHCSGGILQVDLRRTTWCQPGSVQSYCQ